MLTAAFLILGCAVLLGTALAVRYLQPATGAKARRMTWWPLAALHGLCGIGGLICLLIALRGPARGVDYGAGSFGAVSAALLALAALAGGAVLVTHLRTRRRAATLIGVHATLAVSGFVILAAYLLA